MSTSSTDLAIDTGTKLGKIGQAFYFHPDTVARGQELGMKPFQFYGLGRGGVLGDVDNSVVHSAFGYFHPAMIDHVVGGARELIGARECGREYMECARNLGRATFADLEGLAEFSEAAEALADIIDGTALTLYVATAAEPLCADLPGRAMQHAVALREWRGSVHLVAIVGSGLDPVRAHVVKRPDDYAMFGYRDEMVEATEQERAAHEAAEGTTNEICSAALAKLTDEQRTAYAAGVDAMAAALGI
jgi:hypothetical protein